MRQSTPVLQIGVLGPLEILVDGEPLVTDTRKAPAIVALLAVEGRAYARDELAALFWAESDDEAARGSLRRTLSALRAGLGGRWLSIDRASVELDRDAVAVDLHEVARLADDGSLASLARAAELVRGPFLAGFHLRDSPGFDDWRAIRASTAESLGTGILDRLVTARETAGDLQGALEAARRLLEVDPLDEAAHRRVMVLLAATGDRAGAIRQYRRLVAILDRELGVAPLTETSSLYESIREAVPVRADRPGSATGGGDERPALATEVPPRAPGDGPPGDASQVLPFVGRDQELSVILEAHRAAAVAGRIVGIEGEPGIGKTRLAHEAALAVRAQGAGVLSARAYAAESGIAYAPITALLRAWIRGNPDTTPLGDMAPGALAVLGRIVDLPPDLARRAAQAAPLTDPSLARGLLIEALASAITRLLRGGRPGVLLVDDLQWADASTLELLGSLARRLADRPLLLVLAWRAEDLSTEAAALVRLVGQIAEATELRLERLPAATMGRLVQLTVRPPEGRVPDAMVDALVEASEGLPLYLAERLAEPPPGHPDGLPPGPTRGFRALLHERLGRVSETSGQVLAAGAVIGRSFDLATVRAASGRTEDETVAALEELLRRGLLRESDAGGDLRFDFAHGSLRDAAYESTSLVRRRILHRRVAEALRAGGEGLPGATALGRLALVARHEAAAGRAAEAADAYARAAVAARAVHANHEAAELLLAAQASGHPDTTWLQRQLGEVRFAMGDYTQAVAALEAAAGAAEADQLPELELLLGRVHARRGDTAAAVSHLEAALATVAGDEGRLRARILVERSVVALRRGEPEDARAAAAEALRWAEEAGDTSAAGLVHRVRGLIARAEGQLDEASKELELSLSAAVTDPDPGAWIAAANALALVRAAQGDGAGAVTLLGEALERAGRMGMRHVEAAIENNLADRHHEGGEEDRSREHLRRAVTIFAELGGTPGELAPEIWKLESW